MKRLGFIFILFFLFHRSEAHPSVGIVKNSKGEIFYTDTERVWKISADGKTKKVVVPNVHTHELFMDTQDNLYGEHLWYEGEKTDKWGHFVWKLSANGTFSKVIPNKEGFLSNYSFTRDTSGNMLWIERGKKESLLMKRSLSGNIEVVTRLATTDVRWQFCKKNGDFYFIDNNDLKKISNKQISVIAKDLDGVSNDLQTTHPNHNIFGIWDDDLGNIYVAVTSNKYVKKITPQKQVSIVYTSKGDWIPTGGIIANSKLWVLECDNDNKMRVVKTN